MLGWLVLVSSICCFGAARWNDKKYLATRGTSFHPDSQLDS